MCLRGVNHETHLQIVERKSVGQVKSQCRYRRKPGCEACACRPGKFCCSNFKGKRRPSSTEFEPVEGQIETDLFKPTLVDNQKSCFNSNLLTEPLDHLLEERSDLFVHFVIFVMNKKLN